jgi:FAD/FMN-containing dehydrogenase/Fe-S oxidoreductase
VDEQQREHVRDDLKGLIKGELLFDDLSRVLYSTDASIFEAKPLGVAVPRDEEEVQNLVRYAYEHRIPLLPRGAGTGLAGESLGTGLVIDLSRHFQSVLDIGTEIVRVQPGVVYDDLNKRLADVGRRFAPDPGSGLQCTIGGMLATNASGARLLRYGYTRDHVSALRVVLDTGDAITAARHPREPAAQAPAGHREDIIAAVIELLEQNAEVIRASQPRTPFNRCGYLLPDVLGPDALDLARLLVGSEGTLGIFTEATLKTVPLPVESSMVLLGFASLEAALRAGQIALATGPTACELFDGRLLALIRCADAEAGSLIPAGADAALLVEYESDSVGSTRRSADELVAQVVRSERVAGYGHSASQPAEVARLRRLRAVALPALYGLAGRTQAVPLIEDVAVPLDELSTFLRRLQDSLREHDVTASFLVHAGTGQVHARPFLDLDRPEDSAKLWSLADDVHSLALQLGGTISTQHGTGLARTPWVARQYGRLYPVFRDLKAIFDPRRILNPGKIVGLNPERPPWPLRRRIEETPAVANGTLVPPNGSAEAPGESGSLYALRWRADEMPTEIGNCNGCGACRAAAPAARMCPIFHAEQVEAATPRAKANLMRHLLLNPDPRLMNSEQVRAVADLCVNCKMCASECPAHVNIPKLMLEAKAANVAEHGLDRTDWVLARTESFAAFGSAFAFLVNAGLASRTVRWSLEKVFGISRRRRLPTFSPRSFLSHAARRGWTRPPRSRRPRVAYFVDVFANYNDPQIAEATVQVLHHHGIEVYVPPGQVGSGIAALAQGDVDAAREAAQTNLRQLADLARDGYTIVCSEPSAALMLRHDYLDLFDDADTRLVAERTVELTSFLWDLRQDGRLRTEFRPLPLSLGHHVPCHVKALGKPPRGPSLLSLIPGLRVLTIDVSCSGMAGTFGLKADSYDLSIRAGRPMLDVLARADLSYGSTECSTCRLQMEEGTVKRTLHPIQYLALAYGLMPDLARRLAQPIRELVLQ